MKERVMETHILLPGGAFRRGLALWGPHGSETLGPNLSSLA